MEECEGKRASQAERFLQTFIVTAYTYLVLATSLFGWLIWFLIVYFSPFLRIPMLLYAAWIYYDRDSAETDSRRCEAFRNWSGWYHYREYFPTRIVKTTDVPADRNYIFAVFPHGILATGAASAMANNRGGFRELFPGLDSMVLTLAQHFHTPFIREYVRLTGALPASASCMNRFLGSEKKGKVLVLLVGGAQESFYSEPGNYTANVSTRKGFVRITIKNGSSLVPVIAFGEPDIYNQIRFREGSFPHRVQMFIKRMTNIAPVLFYGRFLLTPYRKPIHVVVGEPIHAEKSESPTQEEVDALHARFVEKLKELFDREKHKYVKDAENVSLVIV